MCFCFTKTSGRGCPGPLYCARGGVLLARLIRAVRAAAPSPPSKRMSGHRGARTNQPRAASMISAT